jgi:hypothetical protein
MLMIELKIEANILLGYENENACSEAKIQRKDF